MEKSVWIVQVSILLILLQSANLFGGECEELSRAVKNAVSESSGTSGLTSNANLKPGTYINGKFTEGHAFSGKVIAQTKDYIIVADPQSEGAVKIPRYLVDEKSIQPGKLLPGQATQAGETVISGLPTDISKEIKPGMNIAIESRDGTTVTGKFLRQDRDGIYFENPVSHQEDRYIPGTLKPRTARQISEIEKPVMFAEVKSDVTKGDYIVLNKKGGGSMEGELVREDSHSLVLKNPVTGRENTVPKAVFDLAKTKKVPPPEKANFFAFSKRDPVAIQTYAPDGSFSVHYPVHENIPSQGFKLHISATDENAREVADAVLPELRKMGVKHKVVQNAETYATMPGGQKGKFITIYPENEKQAVDIAKKMDQLLKEKGLSGQYIPVAGEKQVGSSGNIFARYGAMTDDFDSSILRVNKTGNAVDTSGHEILYKNKPISINHKLKETYDGNEMKEVSELLERNGAVTKDPRGSYKPDWMEEDPFK